MSRDSLLSPTWCATIFLLMTTYVIVSADQKHFRGGHIHLNITEVRGDNITANVTIVSAWRLDASPCGPGCSFQDIGLSTTNARADILRRSRNDDLFGRFVLEVKSRAPDQPASSSDITARDITTYVNTHCKGRVFDVNAKEGWVQEVLKFNLTLNPYTAYFEVMMSGLSWPDLAQNCSSLGSGCGYHLQSRLQVGERNDTGRHNRGPLLSYRPVYRVPVNTITNISVYTSDPDGDLVSCRWAQYAELGGLELPPGVEVSPECVLTVNTSRAQGFGSPDFLVVPLVAEELVTKPLRLKNGDTYRVLDVIGSTQVNLMIQVVSQQTIIPEFVPQVFSPCGIKADHDAATYVTHVVRGEKTFFLLPIAAKPGYGSDADTEIERFRVTSLPELSVQLRPPQDVSLSGGEKVRISDLTTTIRAMYANDYFLQLLAMDTRGQLSQVCTLRLNIKIVSYHETDDYFTGTPGPSDIRCPIKAKCDFPVFVKRDTTAGDPTLSVESHDTALDQVIINGQAQSWWHGGSTKFQVYLRGTEPGSYNVCLRLNYTSHVTSKKCVQVNVIAPDPCVKKDYPCTDRSRGTCLTNVSDPTVTYCQCDVGFSGSQCETRVDPCSQGYCGPNSLQCVYNPALSKYPLCKCATNYGGDRCEQALNCLQNPCRPFGDCVPTPTSFKCVCHVGYAGQLCEKSTGSFTLTTSSTSVRPTVTDSLLLNCSFTTPNDPEAAVPVWLTLLYANDSNSGNNSNSGSSGFQDLATVSTDSGAVLTSTTQDLGNVTVSGTIQASGVSSLLVVVHKPLFRDARMFRCDSEAVDAKGPLVRSSNTVRVKSEPGTLG